MKKVLPYIVISLAMVAIVGCSSPDEKANSLFIEAFRLVEEAQEAEKISYIDASRLYEKALKKTEIITTKYPSSTLAVQIVLGKVTLAGYTLSELKEILTQVRMKAKAEGDLRMCAMLVASTITPSLRFFSKDAALADIAISYAEAGDFSMALDVVKTISDASDKFRVLADVARKYAEAGHFDQALEVARAIKDPYYRSQALTYIAGKYEEAEIKAETSSTLSQSIEAIKTIKDPHRRVSALTEIALTYAKSGMGRKASEILSQALKVAETEMEDDWFLHSKSFALSDIATNYAEIGQYYRALEIARTIKHPWYKSAALANIAVKCVQAGMSTQASEILSQAFEIAKTTREPDALANVAVKYAEIGMSEKASAILSEAIDLAKNIRSSYELADIAKKYAEAGQFDQALELTRGVEDAYYKSQALVYIASKYEEHGKQLDDTARKILHEILMELNLVVPKM